jgi:hypothetical protein
VVSRNVFGRRFFAIILAFTWEKQRKTANISDKIRTG